MYCTPAREGTIKGWTDRDFALREARNAWNKKVQNHRNAVWNLSRGGLNKNKLRFRKVLGKDVPPSYIAMLRVMVRWCKDRESWFNTASQYPRTMRG